MNAYWKYRYNNTLIEIKNSTAHTELYVDGKQVDSKKGLISVNLSGSLPSGEMVTAEIKAGFVPSCVVKVNDETIQEEDAAEE